MKILNIRLLLMVPLLVVASLLALTIVHASSATPQTNTMAVIDGANARVTADENDIEIKGEGTFTDRKAGEVGAPEILDVKFFIPGEVPKPGEEVFPEGFDPATGHQEFPECGGFVGKYAFGQGLDVICYQRLVIDFAGIISGHAMLDETFTVYGDAPSDLGGNFNGMAACDCTVTLPDGTSISGRVDFFPNYGTFDGGFFGGGQFGILRAYGDLEGLTGTGAFEGIIGLEGEYETELECLCFQKEKDVIIDFEGLSAGKIVDEVSSGSGINGVVNGTAKVYGVNSNFEAGTNAAMIFDATCDDGCSGGDDDLKKPESGNVLIISENLVSDNPDDNGDGGIFNFDFSGLGSGSLKVYKLNVLDAEDGGTIVLRSGGKDGSIVDEVGIKEGVDNGLVTVEIEASGVDYMSLELNGSGAIDEIWLKVIN